MIQPIKKDPFEGIKMGDRVMVFCGAGYPEEYGKVYGRIRNERFGDQLRIKLDNYTFTTAAYFVESGIGFYLLKGGTNE